jgi:hypothetical protein
MRPHDPGSPGVGPSGVGSSDTDTPDAGLRRAVRRRSDARHAAARSRPSRRAVLVGAVTATAAASALALVVGLTAMPGSGTERPAAASAHGQLQTLVVPGDAQRTAVVRDSYTAADPVADAIAGGTNHDWARLVLVYAGLPVTDANVAVLTRWMRQENGPESWWTRNNPLNNGNGSGGGSGLGTYDSLDEAARYCADSLTTYPGYAGILRGLQAGGDTAVTERAIWASPWASSHYANGAHWSSRPVEVVQAPASAWE